MATAWAQATIIAGIAASIALVCPPPSSLALSYAPRGIGVRTGGTEVEALPHGLRGPGVVELIAGHPVRLKLHRPVRRVRLFLMDGSLRRIGRGRTAENADGRGWRCTLPRRLPESATRLAVRVLDPAPPITRVYYAPVRVSKLRGGPPRDPHPCFDSLEPRAKSARLNRPR